VLTLKEIEEIDQFASTLDEEEEGGRRGRHGPSSECWRITCSPKYSTCQRKLQGGEPKGAHISF